MIHGLLTKRFGMRSGTSLLETIIVLCIIGTMLAFLFPAVERAREAASNAVCKNNLHQLESAVQHFWGIKKKLPDPDQPNTVGGWAIDILPYLEEKPLADQLAGNPSLNAPNISEIIRHRPRIMTCPSAWDGDSGIPTSHYAMWTDLNRTTFNLGDAPPSCRIAWVQSPEANLWQSPRDEGPHSGGYNISNGQGSTDWFSGR
jgi:type II secretory pathway pseudopilin PulG